VKSSAGEPGPRRASLASWIAGAWLVLLFHGFAWRHASDVAPLGIPETPVDRVSPDLRGQWTFLMDARAAIPPGADYTVRAETPDREMSLYMLSIGVFPRSRPIPSSYYGTPLRALGSRAAYVVDEGCRFAETPPARTIARFRGGCVKHR
jgi:hypothetical protein